MVKNTKSDSLISAVKERVRLVSIIYSDICGSCNSLNINGFRHFRINHRTDFAQRENHINSIENFRSQAKHILRKYNGIPKEKFPLVSKRVCV